MKTCINSNWVSASSLKNYILNDCILDWFKYSSKKSSFKKDQSKFVDFITDAGHKFEAVVISHLKERFPNKLITIAETRQVTDMKKAQNTLLAMEQGTPIIYQGVLHNHTDQTYGVADLIVRSDYLSQIFDHSPINDYDASIGCKFSRRYHYRIIDIKYSTIQFNADHKTIRNQKLYPAYKAQLLIYTNAIGQLQDYTPGQAYILGRRWQHTKCRVSSSNNYWFDRAGIIDYDNRDTRVKSLTKQAIAWVRNVRKNAHLWTVDPPNNTSLFPNMKNKYDTPYHSAKKQLADKYCEITSVYQCGVKHRMSAIKHGITNWKNPQCSAEVLGHKGKKLAPRIDAILDINRDSNPDKHYTPDHLVERLPKHRVEIFIDFETTSDITDDIPTDAYTKPDTYVFLIGVTYQINKGPCKYKSFCTKTIGNKEHEQQNFLDFLNFINDCLLKHSAYNNHMFYHWGHVEYTWFNQLCNKYNINPDLYPFYWYDLCSLFTQTPITIKGCLNFKLKDIARSLKTYNYITTQWEENGVSNGLDAMLIASQASKTAIKKSLHMKELPDVKSIIKYNKIDCQVLYEILQFLRNNLVKKKRKNLRRSDRLKKKRRICYRV